MVPPVNVLAVATAVPPHTLEQRVVTEAARQAHVVAKIGMQCQVGGAGIGLGECAFAQIPGAAKAEIERKVPVGNGPGGDFKESPASAVSTLKAGLAGRGIASLRFDYAGFGESEGAPG